MHTHYIMQFMFKPLPDDIQTIIVPYPFYTLKYSPVLPIVIFTTEEGRCITTETSVSMEFDQSVRTIAI